jgi:probable F420-dependent oxidoreductase
MPHDRKFRFGVQLHNAPDAKSWADQARKAEDLGYSTAFMPDHFGDQLAPVPALMAAADATTDLRVGALVLDNDYKHPVVLAKEMATIDVLSNGRLEVGIGAGWMKTDYEQSGIPYDPPGVRVDRFEEGLAVLKGMFAEGAFSYDGDHYKITELDGMPKPAQSPHPPFLIGGGGRRMLSIAAREADIVSVNPNLRSGEVGEDAAKDATAEATDRKVAWLRAAAGDRWADLELSALVFVAMITDDREGVAQMLSGNFGVTPEEALSIPHALVGTVDQLCEDLEARRERWGFSYFVVQGDAIDTMAPIVAKMAGT